MDDCKAMMRIVLEAQAWLYADLMRLRTEKTNEQVTEEMFNKWRDEWMEETRIEFAILKKEKDTNV